MSIEIHDVGVMGQIQANAGSAMEADTSVLYWFEPSNGVTLSGSDLDEWTDKSGNVAALTESGGGSAPAWNSSPAYAEFTAANNDFIATSARLTGGTVSHTLDGGGEAAVFVVVYFDATDTGGLAFCEHRGAGGSDASNEQFIVKVGYNAGNTSIYARMKAFSNAFILDATAGSDLSGIALLEFWCDQTSVEMLVNGTSIDSDTPTTANFQGNDTYIGLGGNGNSSVAPGLTFDGRVYEVFATADASTGNRAAIRSELTAKYSI